MKESLEGTFKPLGARLRGRLRNLFTKKEIIATEIAVSDAEPVLSTVTETMRGAEIEKEEIDIDLELDEHQKLGFSSEQLKQSYLERLAKFEFMVEGNPYLKAAILHAVEVWENEAGPHAMWYLAARLDRSIEEVQEVLQQRIEELMQQVSFFLATDAEVFTKHILGGDRRYKSQFETNSSNGCLCQGTRSAYEHSMFGFPEYDTPEGESAKSYRPIYGYFSLDENGILNTPGKNPPPNNVVGYGNVTVRIKREIAARRATVSFMDSMSLNSGDPISLVALPHYSMFFHNSYESSERLEALRSVLEGNFDNSVINVLRGWYTEVQYHGGLTVEDIESVHLSTGNGLNQEEIDRVTAAVAAYNQETGGNILVVLY